MVRHGDLLSGVAVVLMAAAALSPAPLRGAARGTLEPAAGDTTPIRILSADTLKQGAELQELQGHVVLERGTTMRLSAERMEYRKSLGRLDAFGTVEVKDPSFTMTCSRLTYSTLTDEAVAWDHPLLRQVEVRSQESFETELSGVQVRVFTKERRVQVLEDVVLTRYRLDKGVRVAAELRVRCRTLDALSVAKQSSFKGSVSIETATVGAVGERAMHDQIVGKFYILGNAEAWNYGESGQKINVVKGDKIVYFIKQRRTVVIGNVTADVASDARQGEARLPLKVDPVSRPGEVLADE